jgi:hypothetical protein
LFLLISRLGTAYALRRLILIKPAHVALGQPRNQERLEMNNRNVQNGLVLAGALVVLFSLMFATSVAVSRLPVAL